MVEVMTGIGRQFGVLPNQPTLRVAGARSAPPSSPVPGPYGGEAL